MTRALRGVAGALGLLTLVSCAPPTPVAPGDIRGLVDRELGEAFPKVAGVGLVAGVIKGTSQEVVTFGDAKADWIFELGSATQVLTGVLLADMVSRGRLALEDPISKLLPPGVGAPRSEAGREITLEDLATHRAALPRFPPNLVPRVPDSPRDPDNPWAGYTETLLWDAVGGAKIARPVGETVDESLYGYGLLGTLLSRAGGRPYGELLTAVTKPLGMAETTTARPAEDSPRLAIGHIGRRDASHWDLPSHEGAIGAYTTVADMLRFLRANVDPASSPLRAAIELAQQPRAEDGERRLGLGWRERTEEDVRILWQDGTIHGFRSFVGFAPGKGVGVVVLANVQASLSSPGRRLVRLLASMS